MQPNQSVPYKRIAASAVSIALEDRQPTPCQQQQAIIGTNSKVEVQQTLGSALTVTAVTLATPPVATSTAHGLANGDVVVFTVAGGMIQLDQQAVRVANVAANTFELEGMSALTFSAWTAGTAQKVTAWQTLASAQNVTMPNPAPAKIDVTTLIDQSKQYVYGLPDAPDGTVSGLFNPGGTAEGLIRTATLANGNLVWRVSWGSGQKSIFNAFVSGGYGFNAQTNQALTADIAFTPRKQVMHYLT